MFTNMIYGVPLGEDDKIDDSIPKNEAEQKLKDGRPLTREEISKLTSEQSADYFGQVFVENLNRNVMKEGKKDP